MPTFHSTKATAKKQQAKLRKEGYWSRLEKHKDGYKVTRTRAIMVTKDPKGKEKLSGRLQRLQKTRKTKGRKKAKSRSSQSFRFFG